MHLVMFDVDGTLTHTNTVDNDCFLAALNEIFNIADVDRDWTTYTHVTYQYCFFEIVRRYAGREASQDELLATKKRHVQLLQEKADTDTSRFQQVAGADEALAMLQKRPDVTVALATGAWLEPTRIKLQTAGLKMNGIPTATSNDSVSREEIMRIAEARAQEAAGVPFRTRTYVGDGVWDVHAAANLSYYFIGVGTGAREETLRAEGAKRVVPTLETSGAFPALLKAIWNA